MLDPVALLVAAPESAVAPDPRPAVPASSAVTLPVVGAAGVSVAALAVAAGLSVAPVTVAVLAVALCALPACSAVVVVVVDLLPPVPAAVRHSARAALSVIALTLQLAASQLTSLLIFMTSSSDIEII